MLAPRRWGADLLGYSGSSFDRALGAAGESWRPFRLGKHPTKSPHQDDKSPEWLRAIRSGDNRHPIAALGLPVSYHSRVNNMKVQVQPTSATGDKIRRASPIWVVAELTAVAPELVVCLGAVAAKALLGPSFRVSERRGEAERFSLEGVGEYTAIETVHPSSVLRAPDRTEAFDGFVRDLEVVRDRVGT